MTPSQSRMARAALKIGVIDVAKAAKVSTNTITRFEAGEALRERTVDDLKRAYEGLGIQFLDEGDVALGPGVALK